MSMNLAPVSRSDFKNMKRVLIKADTSVVTHSDGTAALSRIAFIVEQITRLVRNGVSVILVSSGSIGIGKQKLSHHLPYEHKKDPSFMRSFAATGQSALIRIYEFMFSHYNVQCAQVLLTDDDFKCSERKSNLKRTLDRLLSYHVVPILNENDALSSSHELKIVRNIDSLACLVATEMGMELTILLTDGDNEGVYKEKSCDNERAQIIDIYEVSNTSSSPISEKIKSTMDAVNGTKETRTVDGVLTSKGSTVMAVVIASGQMKDSIDRIIRGENIGTLFVAKSSLSNTQLNYVQ